MRTLSQKRRSQTANQIKLEMIEMVEQKNIIDCTNPDEQVISHARMRFDECLSLPTIPELSTSLWLDSVPSH